MTSALALLISSAIFSLCLVTVTVLLLLDRRKDREATTSLTAAFLTEISETRKQQQLSLDEVFTGLLTATPHEYATVRQTKVAEAAQRQYLASVEYAETQKAQEASDREREAAEQVAIREQYEQEQEDLDAVVGSVYGGVA